MAKLNPNTVAYWNRRLKREGLTTDRGRLGGKLTYANPNMVEGIDLANPEAILIAKEGMCVRKVS